MFRRLAVVASLVSACGGSTAPSEKGVTQENSQPAPAVVAAPLPACVADRSILRQRATTAEVEACAGRPCSITLASQNGTKSDDWLYCLDGCNSTCASHFGISFYEGRVIAIGVP